MKYSGKLTLKNNFHNTEAVVIVQDGIIGERAYARALKKLCGISECCCGGTRGPQDMIIEECWDFESNKPYAVVG